MKRVYNDTKSKPEKAKNKHLEIYDNRRVLPKKLLFCTNSTKFNSDEVKIM
jgi:hypothetical protein